MTMFVENIMRFKGQAHPTRMLQGKNGALHPMRHSGQFMTSLQLGKPKTRSQTAQGGVRARLLLRSPQTPPHCGG